MIGVAVRVLFLLFALEVGAAVLGWPLWLIPALVIGAFLAGLLGFASDYHHQLRRNR
jgi:hypothetical protein